MQIKKVGVIGAGIMGRGVAQNLAEHGYQVILIDLNDDLLNKAKTTIRKNIRFARFHGQSDNTQPIADILASINTSTDYNTLQDVDFVVENVIEKWTVKKEIYPKLDQICPAHCIFAVNTSAISITRVGSVTNRPEQIIGMHFMNPVPFMPTVEVIKGYHTSEKTIEIAKAFLKSLNKTGVIINDAPGFVTNRVLMLTINEAIYLVQEHVAKAADVDEIFRSCFGHKMGPLETADLIGLDTILYSIEELYLSYNDSKYRPCPLLKKMVDAGLRGRKSGEGFYNYYQKKS